MTGQEAMLKAVNEIPKDFLIYGLKLAIKEYEETGDTNPVEFMCGLIAVKTTIEKNGHVDDLLKDISDLKKMASFVFDKN